MRHMTHHLKALYHYSNVILLEILALETLWSPAETVVQEQHNASMMIMNDDSF